MPGQRKKAPASPLLFACLLPARALLPSVIFLEALVSDWQ